MPTQTSNRALLRRIRLASTGASLLVVAGISLTWLTVVGEPAPPALSTTRFSVAVLSGPKQAAQSAPDNVDATVEEVVVVPPEPKAPMPVVVADRSTALPDAVKATPDAKPSVEVASPVEVIPPARVSMPGGRLSSEDAPVGDIPDPFAIGPTQVFIRLHIGADGRVTRGGIVRNGREPMRDLLMYKAMASRSFDVKALPPGAIRLPGELALWQVDMVLDYGTNEFLP